MNKKLLAGLAVVGLLAGGGSVTAQAADAPAAFASAGAVGASLTRMPGCGPLGSLTAKGTITEAQAIAIHNGFIRYMQDHWRNILNTVLGQQVKNHTITQAQASAVATAITQWIQNYRGEGSGHHAMCHHGQGGAMNGGSGNG